MSPQWTRLETAPAPAAGPVYLDAELSPNRSLSQKAFALVFGAFALINLVVAIGFVAAGAYPVAGFMGLDVVLFGAAFAISYRDGRARERVLVAGDRLHVARVPAKGAADHWIVHPHWVRVETAETAVNLAAGGQSVPVAAFLSPDEREDFAGALAQALRRAREERWPVADQSASTSRIE
ncbi:MAG: DUF2244 domain-containing protein [Alphaproteobacteria bacterium]|nr:DUF2244 domain-containing protein [Alphaproteobacteria bacterium]